MPGDKSKLRELFSKSSKQQEANIGSLGREFGRKMVLQNA